MTDGIERWVPWASFVMFVFGLWGGYSAGGWLGFGSVWIGASGLFMTAVCTMGADQ